MIAKTGSVGAYRGKPEMTLREPTQLALLVDPSLHSVNVDVDCVHPGEHGLQQERVMLGEPPGKGLFEAFGLAAQRPAGELRKNLWVAFLRDQRGHHVPPGDPKHVSDDNRDFDHRVLEELFHSLFLRRPRRDQVHPVPGQIT